MFEGSVNVPKTEHMRARAGQRRLAQRDHQPGPDQLLRDDAGRAPGAGALARGRPDGRAGARADPGDPRQPARRGQERAAAALRERALRRRLAAPAAAALPRGPPVPPPDDRVDGGPQRGRAGHLPGLPPQLLRARQRGADGGRRRRAGRGVRAGRAKYFGGLPAGGARPPAPTGSLADWAGPVSSVVAAEVPAPRVYLAHRTYPYGTTRIRRGDGAGHRARPGAGQPALPAARRRRPARPARHRLRVRRRPRVRARAPDHVGHRPPRRHRSPARRRAWPRWSTSSSPAV